MAKRKKKAKRRELDVDQILLRNRQLFLFGAINEKLSRDLIRKMLALDLLSRKPILLWINSPGGSVDSGFSMIDTMRGLRSPVVTVIIGEACSMAGVVAVAGTKRLMTKNSIWMGHDMSGGIWGDYTTKVLDRADFLKQEQKRLFDFLKEKTKLSEKELTKARNGELWLYPDDCKKKGIIDKIIK